MEKEIFDEQGFIETYLSDYYSNDLVAVSDDLACLLDGEFKVEDDPERFGVYEGMSRWELEDEYNRVMRIILRQAFKDYVNEFYPLKKK